MTGIPILSGIGIAGRLAGVGSFFKQIPWQIWLALGIVCAAILGGLWHHHRVDAFGKAQFAAGENAAYANIQKQAITLARQANTVNRQIAAKIRSQADAQKARVITQFRTVLLRGPGAAACTSIAGLPASPSGSQQAAPETGAPVAPVPAATGSDLIAMPFTGTATVFAEHDWLLKDDQALRDGWTTFTARWEAWQKAAAKVRAK